MLSFATRLYGLYHNGTLTHISDNTDMLKPYVENASDDIIKELTNAVVPEDQLESFDIIVNDSDNKEYGFSEVYQKEDGTYDVTMWKYRLNLNLPYPEAVEELTEAIGCWEEAPSVKGVLSAHNHYWRCDEDITNAVINGFLISDKEKDMLLQTGFESNMIILVAD